MDLPNADELKAKPVMKIQRKHVDVAYKNFSNLQPYVATLTLKAIIVDDSKAMTCYDIPSKSQMLVLVHSISDDWD